MKRTYGFLFALGLSLLFAGCSSYSITSPDGKVTLSGSTMNGAASVSSGTGCTPTSPSPGNPAPATPPTIMMQRQICDMGGRNCQLALVQAMVAAPTCDTQVVNVHGTDLTTLLQWGLGGAAAGFLLAK